MAKGAKKKKGAPSKKKNGSSKDNKDSSSKKGDNASSGDMLYQQSMEARIEGMKERVEQLREENATLKMNAKKTETDTHEFVAYFQTEMEKKDQLIARISEQLTKQEIDFGKQQRQTTEEARVKVTKAQEELEETKARLESKVKILEDELAVLTEYKHKRNVLNTKLEEAQKELEQERQKHKLELNDIERQFIEKSAKLQRDVDTRIESIKRQAREDAQEGLDADTRKIIADNQRMGEELRFQLQTSDELQQQGRQLLEENKRLKRNLSLATEKDHEYANRGYYKENELQMTKQKIKSLEKTLSQTVREFDQTRKRTDLEYRKRTEDLELGSFWFEAACQVKEQGVEELEAAFAGNS